MHSEDKKWSKEDICSHWGEDPNRHLGAIVPPIFQNTLFTRKTQSHGYVYSRINNPTMEVAEKKLAALEEGEDGLVFSSGMGAITAAIMNVVEKDSHVVTLKTVYPPTREFFESYLTRFGVNATFIAGLTVEEFERAIQPNTKLIYLETPLSNIFTLQDLRKIAALAKSKGITTIVDNSWSTPLFQSPLSMGIDIVVHSASKYLGGHSDILGGVLVASAEIVERIRFKERALYGAVMDPHQAWLLTRGLRTLPLRMRQHEEHGLKVAQYLESHVAVDEVYYPGLASFPQADLAREQMSGFSSLLSFRVSAKPEKVREMIRSLRVFEEGPSWGSFESLINTPGVGISEEASELTAVPNGLIRIFVGLEHIDSILEDLEEGLKHLR